MINSPEPYSKKVYGILKGAYGDKFTHTEESFSEKLASDPAYVEKVYGMMKTGYGDKFEHTPESFTQKLQLQSGAKKKSTGFWRRIFRALFAACTVRTREFLRVWQSMDTPGKS